MNNGVLADRLRGSDPNGVDDAEEEEEEDANGVTDAPPRRELGMGVVDIDREALRMFGVFAFDLLLNPLASLELGVEPRATDWDAEVRAASGSIPPLEPE